MENNFIGKMIEIEKFIEQNDVTELCDLSMLVRETHPEWYMEITRNTEYFEAFIRSRRHKAQGEFDLFDIALEKDARNAKNIKNSPSGIN